MIYVVLCRLLGYVTRREWISSIARIQSAGAESRGMLTLLRSLCVILPIGILVWCLSVPFPMLFWCGCGSTLGSFLLLVMLICFEAIISAKRLRVAVQQEDAYYNDPSRDGQYERGLRRCSWTLQFTEEQVSVQHLEIANLTNSISLISYDFLFSCRLLELPFNSEHFGCRRSISNRELSVYHSGRLIGSPPCISYRSFRSRQNSSQRTQTQAIAQQCGVYRGEPH